VIAGIGLDLDDTLYQEADYVRSGFMAVATAAGASLAERAELAAWLLNAFESGVRGDTFDGLLERFPHLADRMTVADLVDVYRQHVPAIAMAEDVALTLARLTAAGVRLGVVTDGPTPMQAAKVRALGLERWCSPIILTDTLGTGMNKPHPAAFEALAAQWGLNGDQLAYVGDNPRKDFVGPRRLGWSTVRLRRAGQLHAHVESPSQEFAPDLEIADLVELPERLGLSI